MRTILSVLLFLTSVNCLASDIVVSPPNWWVNMANSQLQLMVNGKGVGNASVSLNYDGAIVKKSYSLDNNNYLFIDLMLDNEIVNPGVFELVLRFENGETITVPYELKPRREGSAKRQGFSSKDVIYLITPDRFANGDTQNDAVAGYEDKPNLSHPGGRHGGDIAGMIQQLDYIKSLGVSQIWTMPMFENAMEQYSYHGYSITDHFRVDPRFGSNTLYAEMSQLAKQKGIGVIIDLVLNHIGSNHPWMEDLPSESWINNDAQFTPTTHRREALHDPYGVESDIVAFSDGWFVPTMPDLNQRVPELATFLTQHAIWWVEYADLSGIRVDTYSYSDKAFLSKWTAALMDEYPNLNIVGEEWSTNPLITAYWQKGSMKYDNYQSELPSVMDFPLQTTLVQALTQEETWATGLRQLYELLASDFVYGDPYNLVIFADNHDMSRIYSQLNENYQLWDITMTVLATMRGIPQLFYGTEILMSNPGTDDHGVIRTDFPLGFAEKPSAVLATLPSNQKAALERVKQLLSFRSSSSAIGQGKFTQYAPFDGLYVYFRHTEKEKVMVAVNKNNKVVTVQAAQFAEMLTGYKEAVTLTGEQYSLAEPLSFPPNKATVYSIK